MVISFPVTIQQIVLGYMVPETKYSLSFDQEIMDLFLFLMVYQIFVGYEMLKPSLQRKSNNDIKVIARG